MLTGGVPEPLFCVAALYDVRARRRVSESFHVDANSSDVIRYVYVKHSYFVLCFNIYFNCLMMVFILNIYFVVRFFLKKSILGAQYMPDKITQCKSAAFAPTRVGRTIALVLEVCIFINLKRQFKKFHFYLF